MSETTTGIDGQRSLGLAGDLAMWLWTRAIGSASGKGRDAVR